MVDSLIRMNRRYFQAVDVALAGMFFNQPADKFGLSDISTGPGHYEKIIESLHTGFKRYDHAAWPASQSWRRSLPPANTVLQFPDWPRRYRQKRDPGRTPSPPPASSSR